MNKNIEIRDEYIKGSVIDVKRYIVNELIKQKEDSDIDNETLLYNADRFNDLLEQLHILEDNTEIIVRECPMGNLRYEIVNNNDSDDKHKRNYINVVYNYLNNMQGYIDYSETSYLVNGVLNNDTENTIKPTEKDIEELSILLETGDKEEEFYNRLKKVGNE